MANGIKNHSKNQNLVKSRIKESEKLEEYIKKEHFLKKS